jgi:uncharacterized integral membrane protein
MTLKLYAGLVLLLLVVVFIVQNAAVVEIQFLLWQVSMSRSLMIFTVLAIGVVLGWLGAGHMHRKRDQATRSHTTPK